MAGQHAAGSADSPSEERRQGGRKRHRRVRTDPVPGSDPNPAPEPARHSGTDNDDRLRADKPPHWG